MSKGYIIFDGASYFDTGVVPSINTKIEADVALLVGNDNWSCLIGSQDGDDTDDTFQIRRYFDENEFTAKIGNKQVVTDTIELDKFYHIELSTEGFYVDGNLVEDMSDATIAATSVSMMIGAVKHSTGAAFRPSKCKIGEVKFYENGELVADFVPSQDGTAAVYKDKVSGNIILGAGSPIYVGPTDDHLTTKTISALYIGNEKYQRAYLGDILVFGKPYVKPYFCDYLFIDGPKKSAAKRPQFAFHTDYIPNENTEIEMWLRATDYAGDVWCGILSQSGNATQGNYWFIRAPYADRIGVAWGGGGYETTIFVDPRQDCHIIYNKDSFTVNGETTFITHSDVRPDPMCIGALDDSYQGAPFRSILGYYGEIIVRENGTVVRDFKPAFDGEQAGYYETVNGNWWFKIDPQGQYTITPYNKPTGDTPYGKITEDELFYITSDGQTATLFPSTPQFGGVNVISNTYDSEKGVLKFDDALKSIGTSNFAFTSIEELNFPPSLSVLGDRTFAYVSTGRIRFTNPTAPTIQGNPFERYDGSRPTIYVPQGSLAAYQSVITIDADWVEE